MAFGSLPAAAAAAQSLLVSLADKDDIRSCSSSNVVVHMDRCIASLSWAHQVLTWKVCGHDKFLGGKSVDTTNSSAFTRTA